MSFTADNKKYASKKSDWTAPKPGSYNPPKAEKAQHRSEAIGDSAWSDRSYTDTLRSAQPAAKYPGEAVHSDNARAKELLKPDTSGKFFK